MKERPDTEFWKFMGVTAFVLIVMAIVYLSCMGCIEPEEANIGLNTKVDQILDVSRETKQDVQQVGQNVQAIQAGGSVNDPWPIVAVSGISALALVVAVVSYPLFRALRRRWWGETPKSA